MCQQSVTCIHSPSSCSFLGFGFCSPRKTRRGDIPPTPGSSFPLALLGLGIQALDSCSCRTLVQTAEGGKLSFYSSISNPCHVQKPLQQAPAAGSMARLPAQTLAHIPGSWLFPSLQGGSSECPQSQPDPTAQSLLEGSCPSSWAAFQVLPFAAFPC